MRHAKHTLIAAIILTALGTADAAAQGPTSCTTTSQNLYVRDVMSDIYFWYREIPNVDATSFDSPEAYLDAIRYRPLDSTFSYITSRASSDAFFSDSQFIGFGFSLKALPAFELGIADVFPDSPAAEANLSRGDRVVEINGRTIEALHNSGELDGAFGPVEVGVPVDLTVARGTTRYSAHMTKRLVTIPTVSMTRVYEVGGRNVGYVVFKNFVQPSFEALDTAFAELRARDVRELVLDLRYNGGGLVSVAEHLANLIGGARTDGQVLAEYFHNDRNTFRNRTLRFQNDPGALSLDRLIVITTTASASASELIINALRPFMPVVVIGDRTYGKPVGQYAIPFCDKILAAVAFTLRNANGEGDYFNGIAPTCVADDDLRHQFGDAAEDSLREALAFVSTGGCSRAQPPQMLRPVARAPWWKPDGWQSVLGAN